MEGKWALEERRIKPSSTKTLSCTVVFPKGEYINEIIDVFEGDDNDIANNDYWHFLKVNLLLNREEADSPDSLD